MATLISSRATVLVKWMLPIGWLGIVTAVTVKSVDGGSAGLDPLFFAGPLAFALLGFIMVGYFTWGLADAVHDCGDHLRVRRGRTEDRIRLEDVDSIDVTLGRQQKVTLQLARPCAFGLQVSFVPALWFSLNPFGHHPIADELIERARAARSERRSDFMAAP